MGSKSDWETLQSAADTLQRLGVAVRDSRRLGASHAGPAVRIRRHRARARPRSHHRRRRRRRASAGHDGGEDLAAGARRARAVEGAQRLDSLLSIVQMPAGIPVGTLAIGAAGATNAALLAASILANKYDDVRTALDQFRAEQTASVLAQPRSQPTRRTIMRIGIIGAGQLGRMLALAGYPLGLRFVFLDQSADAPGAQVGTHRHRRIRRPQQARGAGARSRRGHVRRRERAGRGGRRRSPQRNRFLPPVAALGASQDRLHEKTLFRQLKIPTPPFAPVDSLADLRGSGREDRHCRACSRRGDSATTAAASTRSASRRTSRPPGKRSARCR